MQSEQIPKTNANANANTNSDDDADADADANTDANLNTNTKIQIKLNTPTKDLVTRKVLGRGKKQTGLYHLLNTHLDQIHAQLSAMIQFEKEVKVKRLENALEFIKGSLGPYMTKMGIEHQTSCVDRPQQNGRVERKHKNILEIARALRFHAHLPLSYWSDCVITATYLINRFPSAVNPNKTSDKMAPRGVPCLFLGYPPYQKGYTLLNLLTHTRFVSRDVTFYEHIFSYSKTSMSQIVQPIPTPSSSLWYEDFEAFNTHNPVTQSSSQNDAKLTNHNVVPNTQNDAQHAASSILEVITSVPSTNFEPTAPVVETRRSGRQHVTPTWLKDYVTPSHVPRANQVSLAPLQHTLQAVLVYADSSSFTAVLVYVDGILITSTSPLLMQELKKQLSTNFHMKDLGDLSYFLGLKVCKNDQGIFISQKKYTTDLLKENGVLNAKPYKLPIDQHVKLQADIGTPLPDPEVYRRLIGKLIYLTITRPDICYTVQLLSQFMQNPTSVHMQAVKHLLRYLLSAHGQGILLAKTLTIHLTAYCDSDWASCPMTRRTKAEYRAMALTGCEVTWLVTLLKDLGIKDLGPVDLKCDNQTTIHIAANLVSTKEQVAYVFTKVLRTEQHHKLLSKLGVSAASHSQLEGECKRGEG
ncbi:cysteine-rich receptor-like protein kinase 8 [Tanacetum coccineum]